MDFVGIGVLLIGIAFVILAIFLSRTLNRLSSVLKGVDQTVEKLPNQLDEVMKETGQLIHNSNDTLADVNKKIAALSPLFYIVGDIGESSRKLSSSLADATNSMKKDTKEGRETADRSDLNGLYGALALGYYFTQKRKTLKEMAQEIKTK
ncbi:DUF948 domain-containing protein [Pontibacillus yanchengensis]|uniref:DUF948 domain-containing protein n=2 Tax=Pontibacillus yanchengensis TaxID=462910 RepID=A0ACC7VG51_9BACI|nr:DUF948 domain-containing protein [Pontibacillus yanchengensis]MYL34566.1 DUF948 domain-containing protein [Pontibacillus yanchengensis]MYL54433.1 DUF948 domain-containing protein [Pontibacillus yanchengensis]